MSPVPGSETPRVAVLIPCRNEARTIAGVVQGFRQALPTATIYVYDNGSTDQTAEQAAAAGAVVRRESLPGKGNVVRRMFADVEADVYVLCDGDGTYPAEAAPAMVARIQGECLDMVTAVRVSGEAAAAYRPGHRLGNRFLTGMVARLFGDRFNDMLSGYRAFSRRFVKSFPALSRGFEIETELTVHCLELRLPVAEIEVAYAARPPGSSSKLRTLRDGLRIFAAIVLLLKEVRPLFFFGIAFMVLALSALVLAWPLFVTYMETGLVPRFPTAILVTGLMLLAFIALFSGIILDSISRGRREMKRTRYLSIPGPAGPP